MKKCFTINSIMNERLGELQSRYEWVFRFNQNILIHFIFAYSCRNKCLKGFVFAKIAVFQIFNLIAAHVAIVQLR